MSGKGKHSKAAATTVSKSQVDKENEGKAEVAAKAAAVRAKLAKKFALPAASKIGGKGSIRRPAKRAAAKTVVDEKKLFTELRKNRVQGLPGVAECFMFFEDGKIIKWEQPQCAFSQSHVFAVAPNERTGHFKVGTAESFGHVVKMHDGMGDDAAPAVTAGDDDDVPELVGGDDFEEAAKKEESK